jgi:branched-chain amino acid transport system permease protein
MERMLLHLLNGVSFGALLFLLASGLSLVLGLMGILNLAHGALFLFGAYVGISVKQGGGHFMLAGAVGGAAAAIIGLAMERGFLRYLHGRILEQVLISFGFIYVLTNVASWIWGTVTQIVDAPISGSLVIGDMHFPKYRLGLVAIGLAVALGLYLFDRSRVGAMVRAGMDNAEMAAALGIHVRFISSMVFCLGAFIAGFAGILGVPIFGAYPEIALDALNLALIVVVVGGTGSIQGALIASLLLGVLDSFGRALLPGIASYTIYIALIIILVFRPSGIMGRRA